MQSATLKEALLLGRALNRSYEWISARFCFICSISFNPNYLVEVHEHLCAILLGFIVLTVSQNWWQSNMENTMKKYRCTFIKHIIDPNMYCYRGKSIHKRSMI